MRVVLITDTHFGVRGDSLTFLDNSQKFFENVFFPYIDKENITTIIHLGDLVDRRKYININTANRMRSMFIDKISEKNIDYHQILGNHDCYFKNTNSINAVKELYGDIKIYDTSTEIEINETKILLVPWICAENKDETYDKIKSTNAQICLGHLEIQGFEMFKGSICSHGENRAIFDKFDMVCSGHFHHRSTSGNVNYLGSHGQFTWSDYSDSRGFHILDTDTRQLTFIENPYIMFTKTFYDDSNTTIDKILDKNFTVYENTICKIVVKNKLNPYWFDMFCDKMEKSGATDIQIVEDNLNFNTVNPDDVASETESTLDIFKKHIIQIDSKSINKIKLENVITDLYNEAINI